MSAPHLRAFLVVTDLGLLGVAAALAGWLLLRGRGRPR